jgi:predicted AlkP superfamily phosphohydrolase/phosphomutase
MLRVLVIGLDGATWSVLEPWTAAGRLPNLRALMDRGTRGVLRSTVPALTMPAWSTFMTGRNPGGHGVFAFQRLDGTSYGPRGLANAADLGAPTVWDIASRAGRSVGVVNVPPSYPIRPVNGYVVGCMLTPPGRPFTAPESLAAELGDYVIDTKTPRDLRPESETFGPRALEYLGALERQTRRRTDACVRLMRDRPVDVFAVVLYALDRMQHYLWTRLRNLGTVNGAGDALDVAIRRLLDAVDDAVGRLADAAGPEADVLVISDHGFTDSPARCVRLNRWLADTGFVAPRSSWRMRRRIVRGLPERFRSRWDTVDTIQIDRRRTRAWAETIFTNTAGIWVHERGRYPLGSVEPGPDYDAVRSAIKAGLEDLRDEQGRRVLRGVFRREEIYHGPFTHRAPDLMVECEPEFGVVYESLRRDLRETSLFGPFREEGYTGTHDPAGIYLFAGPSFAARGASVEASIESIAPTLLHLLDVPVPRGMDGAVCVHAYRDGLLAARPIAYSDDDEPVDLGGAAAPADDADVAEHLRGLGYLE